MDMSYLAKKMLEWEQARRMCDELEAAIRDSVLQLGKTQTVGNVKATYSKGRKRYDYFQAGGAASPGIVLECTTTPAPKTDWRAVCKAAGITEIPFTQSDPSVSVKLTA